MSQLNIRSALETALAAMTPSLSVAYENASFTPVAGTPYQQAHILFADPANPEAGSGYQELGFMQVTLKYPLQAGAAAAAARAAMLRTTFKKNTSFTKSGTIVTVNRTPTIGNGVVDGDRWSVPVKIPFISNQFP